MGNRISPLFFGFKQIGVKKKNPSNRTIRGVLIAFAGFSVGVAGFSTTPLMR